MSLPPVKNGRTFVPMPKPCIKCKSKARVTFGDGIWIVACEAPSIVCGEMVSDRSRLRVVRKWNLLNTRIKCADCRKPVTPKTNRTRRCGSCQVHWARKISNENNKRRRSEGARKLAGTISLEAALRQAKVGCPKSCMSRDECQHGQAAAERLRKEVLRLRMKNRPISRKRQNEFNKTNFQ